MSDFLKINSNTKRYVFKNIQNKAILKALFDGLKFATITSVLKKKGPADKASYRPVSIWLVFIKNVGYDFAKKVYYCRCRCTYVFIRNILIQKRHCYKRGTGLIEKWGEVVLIDLAKDFVILNCNLFIAKLLENGFWRDGLKLSDNFLKNRCYIIKVNSSYTSCE